MVDNAKHIDLTPVAGAVKTNDERTASEERDAADWERIAASATFRALIKSKLKFIVPATIFFTVYYFALPLLVGYAPELMGRRVFGVINIAYLFALSQFFVAWLIAALYVRIASRWDKMAAEIVSNVTNSIRKGN
ncbi:MAG: DUF485 domain-containing protein [Pyrinomonadaceae bacterium]